MREGVSPVPDLIYEDQQEARVRDIAHLLDEPEGVAASDPLHRITVFLTYGCNLACPYCKTIVRGKADLVARPEKKIVYSHARFVALLDVHAGTPVQHLHFTGGEATLVPGLPEMVREAKRRGVERASITSNGTAPLETYRALVEAGIDEIRISLDADDADLGRSLTLRRDAFGVTVKTLEALAALRRERPFFLIVNCVVGLANRERLPRLLAFILGFQPDDVKLITEVDVRDTLGTFAAAARVKADLDTLLARFPPGAFPLLRRKLATVFAVDAIGLEDVSASSDWRCYIPLTERTVDGAYYYPCSVYLREGGRPLGALDEPAALQRSKTAAFVREGDCLNDPICRRYCLACTKRYNIRANERRDRDRSAH